MQQVSVDTPPGYRPKMQPMAAKKAEPRRRTKPVLSVLAGYGSAIVALRKRRDMTQADLIAASKVAQRTASGAENSENIRIDTLDALLAAMGASLMEFCLAVAAVNGAQVSDVEAIETREARRNEYARRMGTDVPFPSDPNEGRLRMLQDRIADLETRLYGVNPVQLKTPKPD